MGLLLSVFGEDTMKIGDLVKWTPDDPRLPHGYISCNKMYHPTEHFGVIVKEEPDPRLGDFYVAWQYGQITCESPHALEVIQ